LGEGWCGPSADREDGLGRGVLIGDNDNIQ
jgi:hypothetical protein